MDETYNVKAIVLNRKSQAEHDSRVSIYSRELGKLELTARGTKKIKSKSAGHLEPLNLVDIMVIRGQKHDYVGTAMSEKCFSNIKNNLAKLAAAGQVVKVVDQLIKPGVADREIFELLKDYLEMSDAAAKDWRLMAVFFILKLLARLGHKPELSRCLACGRKIQPGLNRFDLARGGLVCAKCVKLSDANQLAISDNGIKLLRLAIKCDLKQLGKVKVGKKLGEETIGIIEKFYRFNFN